MMMNGRAYVRFICVAAAVDSAVYGYDTAVISGTVEPLRLHFHLTSLMVGWVVGSALLGCMAGVLTVGRLTDLLGRRTMFALSALLFLISALWCYGSTSVGELVAARILGGVGVGFASLLVPIYIAEIAPPGIRGALVSLHQLGIVTGMNLAYVVNAWIGRGGNDSWLADQGWRVMLGVTGIPAVIFLGLCLVIPESPRWLAKRARHDAALQILRRLHGDSVGTAELLEIDATLAQHQARLRELFRPGVRRIMLMAMTLALFQAITGINVVLYYAPSIFASVGIGSGSALIQQAIIGSALILGTVSSFFVVDRLGRRPIMLMAVGAMGLSLALMGIFFSGLQTGGWGLLVCTLVYVYAFNFGMGGIYWVMVSEIFPTRIRGSASSLSIIFLWGGNYVVLLFFPLLLESLRGSVFYVFSVVCILCFAFMWLCVPETKGKSLEKLEDELYGAEQQNSPMGSGGAPQRHSLDKGTVI